MTETERKFRVLDEGFRKEAQTVKRIVQGYISRDPERTVRIRILNEEAFLTIKGASDAAGLSRYEFEHAISLNEAEELMKLCLPGIIDKERYFVQNEQHTWEVDVFHAAHEGLVIAEIELSDSSEYFEKPTWVGEEVTGDPRYYNAYLSSSSNT